jgi:hypothetical protein
MPTPEDRQEWLFLLEAELQRRQQTRPGSGYAAAELIAELDQMMERIRVEHGVACAWISGCRRRRVTHQSDPAGWQQLANTFCRNGHRTEFHRYSRRRFRFYEYLHDGADPSDFHFCRFANAGFPRNLCER